MRRLNWKPRGEQTLVQGMAPLQKAGGDVWIVDAEDALLIQGVDATLPAGAE